MFTLFAPAPKPEPWKNECDALFGACWNGDHADIHAAWYRAYVHTREYCPANDPHRRSKITYCLCKAILAKRPEVSRTKFVTPDGRIVDTVESTR